MKYEELLKAAGCPFCPSRLKDQECHQVIHQTKHASLLINRAPYSKDHLLVAPVRHITNLESLTTKELNEMLALTKTGVTLLQKRGHTAYSILTRQGEDSGKSVKHSHIHVIPDIIITAKENASLQRAVQTDRQLSTLLKTYKQLLNV